MFFRKKSKDSPPNSPTARVGEVTNVQGNAGNPAARIITSYGNMVQEISGDGRSTTSTGSNYSIYNQGKKVIRQADFESRVLNAILRANAPINLKESEEININGQPGVWTNKEEEINWSGILPISEYVIHNEANPELITKQSEQILEYKRELGVRYLKPPTPPPPGELVIKEEPPIVPPPAPPIIIRKQGQRAATPERIIIREEPPKPPPVVPRQVISVQGKVLAPPARKVVVEELPSEPAKPQSILVEKWLPYTQQKRKVIFQRAQDDIVVPNPKNLYIKWQQNQAVVKDEYKFYGIVNANPAEYVSRFGKTLKKSSEIPNYINEISVPDTIIDTIRYSSELPELEGDLEALNLIDIDREGLSEYRQYLSGNYKIGSGTANFSTVKPGRISTTTTTTTTGSKFYNTAKPVSQMTKLSTTSSTMSVNPSVNKYMENILNEEFRALDLDQNGTLDYNEVSLLLTHLNNKLDRRYGDNEAKAFINALDVNRDGKISLNEFKKAFLRS